MIRGREARFKSILVEDWDRLAWVCHYIHLNPVRAGVCELKALKSYPFSSYWHLRKTRARLPFMSFEAFLGAAGGLTDAPGGRVRYERYLAWLSEDDQAKKVAAFERMSKGWAIGSKEFKRSVLEDEKSRLAHLELGSKDYVELREEMWSMELGRCLKVLGKGASDIAKEAKSVDWKVASATRLKRKLLCRNSWISEHLEMGSVASISRYCSELGNGLRPKAKVLLNALEQ